MPRRTLAYVRLDQLVPALANPKAHDQDGLAASFDRFGYIEPIVEDDRTGRLLSGHGRLDQLQALYEAAHAAPDGIDVDEDGMWLAPVVRGWSSADDDEAQAAVIAVNRLVEKGGWEVEALAEQLEHLLTTPAGLDGTGYIEPDLTALLASLQPIEVSGHQRGHTDPDAVPDPPPQQVTNPGDVWLLGPHRLLCGDATDPDAVATVLAGRSPAMVWADPPYGIGYTSIRPGALIENDENATVARGVTGDALAHVASSPSVFVCCEWRSLATIHAAMTAAGITAKACIVWDKQVRVQNLDRFAKRHEFILYAGPYGGQPTLDTDIWPCARDFHPDHPTPKPVEIIARAIGYCSAPGEVVYDPFTGSGSAVIACHQAGRVAAAVEIDPTYVDVACRRYQDHTGQLPVLESTGQPHDFSG